MLIMKYAPSAPQFDGGESSTIAVWQESKDGKDEKILACSMLQISLKSKLSIFNLIKKLKQELNVVIKEKLKHLNFTS